jgi:DNA-binding transcriptional regulator WhiA
MFDKLKIQEQLDKVQKGCKVRLLSITQVESLINEAENWISDHKLPEDILPYVSFEYVESVAKAYKYSAESTRLSLSFTKKGTVKDITVSRSYAPKGYHTSRFHLNSGKLFAEVYDLEFFTKNEKQRKLLLAAVRSWGFNAGSLTAQV